MNAVISWIGGSCLAAAFLSLVAGAGWWRLSVASLASAATGALSGMGAGWFVWRITQSVGGRGGEWDALGWFIVALFTAYGVAGLVFLVMMIVLAVTKRVIFRRAQASWVLLGLGAALLAGGAAAFTLNTPRHASDRQLIQHINVHWTNRVVEEEILRRGHGIVPEILAELHRLTLAEAQGYPRHNIPPLLRMLGRIGGPEAKANLRRWAGSNSAPPITVAAACALAELEDRHAVPLIVRHLGTAGGEWPSHYPDLLKALGRLKAADQTGTIRTVLAERTAGSAPLLLQAGVEALARIDTDDAWAVIAELFAPEEPVRRIEVLTALEKVPGPRTVALAAKALDDPYVGVRETAFWTLYRLKPQLAEGIPLAWSEENGKKLRDNLQRRDSAGP